MSKKNKVNPDHYHTGGRLSPDDAARERDKQRKADGARRSTATPGPGGPAPRPTPSRKRS
jgi:hypothetical protein